MLQKIIKHKALNLSNKSTLLACAIIFLLSIFLRSVQDIGGDTGFYLKVGQDIANGKRYYYDFFESNFPISFYIYALEYKLSLLFHITPIIMSEIFINLLAILSLFWSHHILKNSELVKENKNYGNLLILSFCLAFFLRIGAAATGEFGTKTTFLLLLLMPYISYSFTLNKNLNQRNLIYRGILMGLIPCFKPHYLIIVIFIETYRLLQVKSFKFFLELDKLVAMSLMLLYFNLILIFTPEFLEFMVPMWSKFYVGYSSFENFVENTGRILSTKIFFFALVAPIFVYLKPSKNDKIFIIFFAAFSFLLLAEGINSIDQEVIFYFFVTAFLSKIAYDFLSSKYFSFSENKFLSLTFLIIPFFDANNFYRSIFGVIYAWWLLGIIIIIYFIFKYKKIELKHKKYHLIIYIILSSLSFLSLKYLNNNIPATICIISFLYFLFLYEIIYKKQGNHASPLLIIIFFSINSFFLNCYFDSFKVGVTKDGFYSSPQKITDQFASYIKFYAPKQTDEYLVFSQWIAHKFPLTNYLNKNHSYIYASVDFYDNIVQGPKNKNKTLFSINDKDAGFVFNYLFDSLKKQIKNKNVKLIFVNNLTSIIKKDGCGISFLEYLLQDREFRKIFFENFTFKNRITIHKEFKEKPKRLFKIKDKFDTLEKSPTYIYYEFEVYIRK